MLPHISNQGGLLTSASYPIWESWLGTLQPDRRSLFAVMQDTVMRGHHEHSGSHALHVQVPGEDPMLTGNYAANFVQGNNKYPLVITVVAAVSAVVHC